MQNEVNAEVIALCITGGKITGQILVSVLKKFLDAKKTVVSHGKQTLKKLMAQNCQLSNIEVTDGNIKSFEKYARKYNMDFSLKKDTSVSPPRYFVFFKARDADIMTAAFKEYTRKEFNKEKSPPVKEKLEQSKERAAKHREMERVKQRERGPEH